VCGGGGAKGGALALESWKADAARGGQDGVCGHAAHSLPASAICQWSCVDANAHTHTHARTHTHTHTHTRTHVVEVVAPPGGAQRGVAQLHVLQHEVPANVALHLRRQPVWQGRSWSANQGVAACYAPPVSPSSQQGVDAHQLLRRHGVRTPTGCCCATSAAPSAPQSTPLLCPGGGRR